MVQRERLKTRVAEGGNYFASPKTNIQFIQSGCKVLDLALGGGWAENRIINIVGDKATAKTLLCIEAAANFAVKYPKGEINYRECESAFDPKYAAALGMPLARVAFGQPMETIEDMFEDLEKVIAAAKYPVLYICDSLDSLSDRAEMARELDEGTYGTGKAKQMSQLFRRLVRKLAESKVTFIVVSQVRANIGVMFGRATTRSGGRALDFYASQVLYLSQMGTIKKTVSGVTRPVGVRIKSKVDKNKVGLPLREAMFEVSFGYGIDDVYACLEWLKEARGLTEIGLTNNSSKEELKKYTRALAAKPDAEYQAGVRTIHDTVEKRWYAIESQFIPKRKKY